MWYNPLNLNGNIMLSRAELKAKYPDIKIRLVSHPEELKLDAATLAREISRSDTYDIVGQADKGCSMVDAVIKSSKRNQTTLQNLTGIELPTQDFDHLTKYHTKHVEALKDAGFNINYTVDTKTTDMCISAERLKEMVKGGGFVLDRESDMKIIKDKFKLPMETFLEMMGSRR